MAEVQEQDGQTVSLTYEPTAADMTGALHARMRGTASGRRTRRLLLVTGVAGLCCAAVLVGLGESDFLRLFVSVFLAVFAFGSVYALPRLQARQLEQLAARQGEFRATVDHRGIRVATRDTETATNWETYPRYAETDDLFVLLSADKHGVGVIVLPKRGVPAQGDVDRLRALLDGHVQRV